MLLRITTDRFVAGIVIKDDAPSQKSRADLSMDDPGHNRPVGRTLLCAQGLRDVQEISDEAEKNEREGRAVSRL